MTETPHGDKDRERAGPSNGNGQEGKGGDDSGALKDGLGLAAILIVGVLAAVGVSGDFLPRLVRNDGQSISLLLMIAIGITGIAIVWPLLKKRSFFKILVVLALTVVLIITASIGRLSQEQREEPGVAIGVAASSPGNLIVTARATASGLRSNEHMLLRIVGIELAALELDADGKVLENPLSDGKVLKNSLSDQCQSGDFPNATMILSWSETGPNTKGEAATDVSVRSKADQFGFYCAYAALQTRGEEAAGQFSWAVIAAEAPVVKSGKTAP